MLRHVPTAILCTALIGSVQAATSITVDQRGLTFSQRSATLSRGDRMVFTNSDDVIHNIHVMTEDDEVVKNLGLQKPGVALAYAFEKAGTYSVRCNIHPSMKLTVTVR